VLSAQITSLTGLYATSGLFCGIGTGLVYVGIVGLMVRWFPDKRGFATGMVAAGYGFGAILTTFPISDMLATSSYQSTLTTFGAILGTVGFLAALGLRDPKPGETSGVAAMVSTSTMNYGPKQMLKTPIFWLMFAMMTMMSTGGLMVTSNFAYFARDFGVADVRVWGLVALPLALTVDRLMNGFTRPFFGWVSDRIGRENTMFLAFALEAVAMAAWLATRGNPVLFVLLSGLVFFGWGEIFSLFPSTLTDTFGPHNATRNYGCLYIAQGIGSIFGGPLASLLHDAAGTWASVFYVAIAADALTAVLAIVALKPLRARYRVAA
jgi:oxalate/formate antiporter